MEDVEENFGRIALLPDVRIAAASLLESEETADRQAAYEILERLVGSAAAAPDLSEIFFLTDVGGEIFFSTEKSHEGTYRVTDDYYLETISKSEPQMH